MSAQACESVASQPRLVTADWTAENRADLEAIARHGVAVVRRDGCQTQVLRDCSAPGKYQFVADRPKTETRTIRTSEELYAVLPTSARQLDYVRDRERQIELTTVAVGQYRVDRDAFAPSDLSGSCEGATHVVTAMTVGAFSLAAGVADKRTLDTGGQAESCNHAESTADPPRTCRELIEIELVAVAKKP